MNHVCTPDPATIVTETDDSRSASCATCGVALSQFVIEDDDRRPRISGWVPRLRSNA